MILDFIHAKNMSIMKSQNKNYRTDEERYNQLKAVEPLVEERYQKGLISKEKYDRFKKQISEWE